MSSRTAIVVSKQLSMGFTPLFGRIASTTHTAAYITFNVRYGNLLGISALPTRSEKLRRIKASCSRTAG